MTSLRKTDNDFTISEVLEYQRKFLETIEEMAEYDNPNAEKVAYLGFMRCRREDTNLTFDDYIENTTASQAQLDAFGGGPEEGDREDELHKDRAIRMARWCLATGFPPSEYKMMTYVEQNAMVEVLIERAKEQNKGKGRKVHS